MEKNGRGQESLRRLLQLYAAIDPEVGYCQGMGFIAGLLLTYMTEDDSFYCFATALQVIETKLLNIEIPIAFKKTKCADTLMS